MILIGGLILALAAGGVMLLDVMIKRGGITKVLAFAVLGYVAYLFLAWQLPYWVAR